MPGVLSGVLSPASQFSSKGGGFEADGTNLMSFVKSCVGSFVASSTSLFVAPVESSLIADGLLSLKVAAGAYLLALSPYRHSISLENSFGSKRNHWGIRTPLGLGTSFAITAPSMEVSLLTGVAASREVSVVARLGLSFEDVV